MAESPIGFVGAGSMGSAIALRLLDRGHRIIIHNRTRANAAGVEQAGAVWAETLADLSEQCAVVMSCLRDSQAVDLVYRGPGGLLSAARAGQIFIEHGTFSPRTAELIAARAAELGAHFLAIPVTGGPAGAAAGQLAAMAGGDASAVSRVRDLLADYARSVTHIGSVARGLELKLVNQLLVTIHLAAAAEAVALIDKSGLPLDISASVLAQGWAASTMLERTFDQLQHNNLSDTGVTIRGLIEVQQLVADKLRDDRLPCAIFDSARALFATAAEHGHGEYDPARLFQYIDPSAPEAIAGKDGYGHRD